MVEVARNMDYAYSFVEMQKRYFIMKATGKRVVDRYPHLQDGFTRREMLVRNAVGSARVEGIRVDEKRLRNSLGAVALETRATPLL
ncbi:hypothetical protein [Hymenobacter sp. IS2118]|uniref:hypothetical protein n=1 Tax=Hymenobacter sp. IS2118 TaxID=1505605 RepID=UPI00055768B5|nr:hypothetical protein [Hymenobacter sp. IS2118]